MSAPTSPWMPTALGLHELALQHARANASERFPIGDERPASPGGKGYAVIDPAPGREEVTRGHGRTTSGSGRFDVRCYGVSRAQAALVMDEVTEIFRDWRPYPERRRFGAVIREDADAIGVDNSVPTAPAFLFLLSYYLPDD